MKITLPVRSLAVAKAKVLTTEIAIEATNKLFELGGTRSTPEKAQLRSPLAQRPGSHPA